MSYGDTFKSAFAMMFEQGSGPILIHSNSGIVEMRAMKNSDRGKVMFQFSDQADVKVGDVIQEEGSRDLWEVYETEDEMIAGTLINFTAWVHKQGGTIGRANSTRSMTVTVHGDNVGGIQLAGENSVQKMGNAASSLRNDLDSLRRITKEAPDLDPVDAEEIMLSLARIEDLSKRDRTSNSLAIIQSKMDFVKGVLDLSVKAAEAAPYILAIIHAIAS